MSHYRLGRFKALALTQEKTKSLGLNTADDARFAVGVDLGGSIVTAAVYQVEAIDAAMTLGC